MPPDTIVGWDLGGAHVKAAVLGPNGTLIDVIQLACPLWKGLNMLEDAVGSILSRINSSDAYHAVTMTGELVDIFETHQQGVLALAGVMQHRIAAENLTFYAGSSGFVSSEATHVHGNEIASANWHASAALAASRVNSGLLIDVGSTTTDLIGLSNNNVVARGTTDQQRLQFDELVYTGIVRTPVMALTRRAPFKGEWHNLMAEHFATSADLYRITGQLPENADLLPSADGGDKNVADSERRLARMIGVDADQATSEEWRQLASYLVECQLSLIFRACQRNLSRGMFDSASPLIGAGAGRFLVNQLASRLGRVYMDFSSLLADSAVKTSADCAAAVAVAMLRQDDNIQ